MRLPLIFWPRSATGNGIGPMPVGDQIFYDGVYIEMIGFSMVYITKFIEMSQTLT